MGGMFLFDGWGSQSPGSGFDGSISIVLLYVTRCPVVDWGRWSMTVGGETVSWLWEEPGKWRWALHWESVRVSGSLC